MDMKLGHTKLIIATGKKHGLLRNQLAYVLATAYWETARTMEPVKEAFWLSEAWRRKNLRYFPWYGRGFVQLTWEANYRKASDEIGVDFIAKPNAVMEPKNSAEILIVGSRDGWFTGKKLSDYITLKRSDFKGARRIINGTDKAVSVAEIAREYDAILKADGYGVDDTPEYKHPAEKIVEDAAADNRTSTTEVTSVLVGAGGVATAAKETVDAVNDAGSSLMSAGPWILLGLVLAGGGYYIWRERRKKRNAAKAVL